MKFYFKIGFFQHTYRKNKNGNISHYFKKKKNENSIGNMSEEMCTFSYISKVDFAPKTAIGVERTWLDLKLEFNRTGEGLAGAKYYKRISEQGPQLFAVKLDNSVWYHDNGKWHRYQTATNIQFKNLCLENDTSELKLSISSSDQCDYDCCVDID